MSKNTVHVSCSTCGKSLPDASRFCPFCGIVSIQNALIETKTTSGFDPYNRNFKPWRDAPLLPKRVFKKDTISVKLPWCPPMRTLEPRRRKVKVKSKEATLSDDTENAFKAVVTTTHAVDNADIGLQSVCDEQPGVDCGDARLIPLTADDILPSEIASLNPLFTEKAVPVAVYDADWLATEGSPDVVVNVSLVEQRTSVANTAYWLRVGVAFPSASAEEGDLVGHSSSEARVDSSSTEDTLHVLAYLSNETARLMYPAAAVTNWVDLFAVDAREYYMAQHMQKLLLAIAQRVCRPACTMAPQRRYLVTVSELDKQTADNDTTANINLESGVQSGERSPRAVLSPVLKVARLKSPRVAVTDVSAIPESDQCPGGLSFNPYIASAASRLRVTRVREEHDTRVGGPSGSHEYIMAHVFLSVAYRNRLESASDVQRGKLTALSSADFQHSIRASHLELRIFPVNCGGCSGNNNSPLPSALLAMEVPALEYLLPNPLCPPAAAPPRGSRAPEYFLSVDDVLLLAAVDRGLLLVLIRRLMRLVRLEIDCTADKLFGWRYSMLGAFSEVHGAAISVQASFSPIIPEQSSDTGMEGVHAARKARLKMLSDMSSSAAARTRRPSLINRRISDEGPEEPAEDDWSFNESGQCNSCTSYRCPIHDRFSCRCHKQEVVMYGRQFTVFAALHWHEEYQLPQQLRNAEEPEHALSTRDRVMRLQEAHSKGCDQATSCGQTSASGAAITLLPLSLSNVFHLTDYVRLDFRVHTQNSLSVAVVDNDKYDRAVLRAEEQTKKQELDRRRANLLSRGIVPSGGSGSGVPDKEPGQQQEEGEDEGDVALYLEVDNAQLNAVLAQYLVSQDLLLRNVQDLNVSIAREPLGLATVPASYSAALERVGFLPPLLCHSASVVEGQTGASQSEGDDHRGIRVITMNLLQCRVIADMLLKVAVCPRLRLYESRDHRLAVLQLRMPSEEDEEVCKDQ